MSPDQYEKIYWKPLKKCMLALIDMGVTPYIYTEGKYNTRIEQLADVPKGKVIYHFENVDMARAKKILGDTAANQRQSADLSSRARYQRTGCGRDPDA